MNSQTWVASGHLGGFSDPLMDCKQCKERFRADKLIEDYNDEHGIEIEGSVDGWSQEQMKQYIEDRGGKVAGSVSSKTGYLVNNDVTSTSSKNKKAQSLGIPIISETQFLEQFS